MSAKRAAFITGGSSGIGLALARMLAARGHGLALFARDKDRLFAAMRGLKAEFRHIPVTTYPVDAGDAPAMARCVAAAINDQGAPEYAIASAGMVEPGLFNDQPLEMFEAQMRSNYFGGLNFAKSVIPHLSGGRLVLVGSGAAFFGIYGYSGYAASKFALRGLAEVLRVELAPDISVTLAYPPDTDTPMLAAENRLKPRATRLITESGGVWSAQDVAKCILRAADKGRFAAVPGLQMKLLFAMHSVLGAALRRWQAGVVRRSLGGGG